jgi:hypothetical protein
MKGKRIDADTNEPNQFPFPRLGPGDFGKDIDGIWYCRPPWKHAGGSLARHTVTEHEDGTITVSPSILIATHVGTWHGYLEHGIWREV